MIMDSLLLFDGSVAANGTLSGTSVNSGTTFTTGANTDSANVIDVSQIASSAKGNGRDIGVDDPNLEIACEISTSFAGVGASMQIYLQAAPDNGSGSPGSYTILAESQVYPVASLTSGTEIFRIKVPVAPVSLTPKFYKLTYVVTGANMTAGAIISAIVLDRAALGPGLGYQSGYSNQYL